VWQIQNDWATVEDCLQLHPDLGEQLNQGLRLAQLAQHTLAPSTPAEEVRGRLTCVLPGVWVQMDPHRAATPLPIEVRAS